MSELTEPKTSQSGDGQESKRHLPDVISKERQEELKVKFEILNGKKVERVTVSVFGPIHIQFEGGMILEIDPQNSEVM